MTKLNVINMAMDFLGRAPIDSSTNKRTREAKSADRFYDVASLYVLKYWDWQEAISSSTLTTEASITNIYNDIFEYVYSLPSDCLRALNLELDDAAGWWVEGNYIYTTYYDASDGITLRYLKDIREESKSSVQYSELLGEVIASRMAFRMAPSRQKPDFRADFEEILYEAIEQDKMTSVNPTGSRNPTWTDTT